MTLLNPKDPTAPTAVQNEGTKEDHSTEEKVDTQRANELPSEPTSWVSDLVKLFEDNPRLRRRTISKPLATLKQEVSDLRIICYSFRGRARDFHHEPTTSKYQGLCRKADNLSYHNYRVRECRLQLQPWQAWMTDQELGIYQALVTPREWEIADGLLDYFVPEAADGLLNYFAPEAVIECGQSGGSGGGGGATGAGGGRPPSPPLIMTAASAACNAWRYKDAIVSAVSYLNPHAVGLGMIFAGVIYRAFLRDSEEEAQSTLQNEMTAAIAASMQALVHWGIVSNTISSSETKQQEQLVVDESNSNTDAAVTSTQRCELTDERLKRQLKKLVERGFNEGQAAVALVQCNAWNNGDLGDVVIEFISYHIPKVYK